MLIPFYFNGVWKCNPALLAGIKWTFLLLRIRRESKMSDKCYLSMFLQK